MPMQRTWNKVITGALALTLISGGGVATLAAPTMIYAAGSLSTPFTDVELGHWAEKHIAKLALQGVINGYSNSVDSTFMFKPSQSVTQQEAVVMALGFAGLKENVDKNAMIAFEDSFVVSSFYKPYIEYAFANGLLDRTEEYAIAAADSTTAWGSKPAAREWITKLIIKTIDEEDLAKELSNASSHFHDADKVDEKYKGYVNAATQLKLIVGYTPEIFGPEKPINRASLATIFSKAQANYPTSYPGQSKGIITNLTAQEMTVYSDDKETTYQLDDSTIYYGFNVDKPISKEQLLQYSDVTVIAKEGKAVYVEALGDVQHTKTIEGSVLRYSEAEKTLYLWIDNKPVEIAYTDALIIEDSEGKALTISDLKQDRQVSVIQDTFRNKPAAIKIVASAQPMYTTVSGKLFNVDSKAVTIDQNGTLVSKYMVNNATVEIAGISSALVSDLIAQQDQVELTLNAEDQVIKVKVLNRDVKTAAGVQVVSYSEDKKLITIVDAQGNNAKALYFTEKTKFDYMGTSLDMKSAMGLREQNVNVIISYTHDKVTSVKFVNSYTGSLSDLNTTSKTITLTLSGGESVTIPYNKAPVDMKGNTIATYNDLKQGDMITLGLNMKEIQAMNIKVHRDIQYEVVSVDLVNKKIRLKNPTTNAYDQALLDIELLNAAGEKQTLNQIKAGSKLNASFVGHQMVKLQTVNTTSNG